MAGQAGVRLIMLVLVLSSTIVSSGCKRDNTGSITNNGLDKMHHERQEVLNKYVPDLAAAAELEDPDREVAYYDAVKALIKEGSAIESQLIEVLATSNEWGQRYGVIEVLNAVGTRASIPMLIESLADDHAIVSLKALSLLRVLCDHREVPAGQSARTQSMKLLRRKYWQRPATTRASSKRDAR